MSEITLKLYVVTTLFVLFVFALFLQSMVLLVFDIRYDLKQEVSFVKKYVSTFQVEGKCVPGKDMEIQSCIDDLDVLEKFLYIEYVSKGEFLHGSSKCNFMEELNNIVVESEQGNIQKISFAGVIWNIFPSKMEALIGALPVKNGKGIVIGTLAFEYSLLPVYEKYSRQISFALLYLLVNTILLTVIGYFRMDKYLLRPLDRLLSLSGKFRDDHFDEFSRKLNGGPFWRLSSTLENMFRKIESDNQKLKSTVTKLEEANKELERSKRIITHSEKLASVGRLSAGLAHEIGNPIGIVQGYLSLLGRNDLELKERKEYSLKAQSEIERVHRLIGHLLGYSRLEIGEVQRFDIHDLIEDAIEVVTMERTVSSTIIATFLRAEQSMVTLEKEPLRQVLVNCVLNGIDALQGFSDEKSIIIETFNKVLTGNIRSVIILIKDKGKGIDEDSVQHLFDPFYTTKDIGEGVGLGLYVSHEIMNRLGGTITIANRKDGKGAVVELVVPITRNMNTSKYIK
ncbi:sensor histidine kinase [Desulforhopalus singaporensis]|uniref:histidine kinase n=1 Tax=Desulforhopalus singaporensis TaxID=91360 RepID=A0A1H0QPQ5_9BACT|nr:HAMP domain-containing sensor histidine kinase [Desulforhopalus singaporensis]SDP19351.1 His Kinase A (phospho-acceptor) domain-containing protein [Desulforhopalus singaporensis]